MVLAAIGVKSVHPHACGENRISFSVPQARSGSPPRVWGKLQRIRGLNDSARFTPTRVGKTHAVVYDGLS